jgi:hypothetical protein
VGINPFYMYLDGTLDMVEVDYVKKNQTIMDDTSYQPKTIIPKDELYDMDEEGNYIYSMDY